MHGEGNSIVCGDGFCDMQIAADPVRQAAQSRLVSDEFLKTLAEDGCQSNGPPVIQACDFIFLCMGTMVTFFKHKGTTDRER